MDLLDGVKTMRVLILDEQPNFRQFLRRVLGTQRELSIVGEASDGANAVELVDRLSPDLILMSLEMAHTGLQTAREIKQYRSGVKVVMLSLLGDEAHRAAAMASGADAFVLKGARIAEILAEIRHVASVRDGTAGPA